MKKLNFVPAAIVAVVKQYHAHRKAYQNGKEWDKQADMKLFEETAKKYKKITFWQASTGTFWVTWNNGLQTIHNEKYQGGKTVATFDKKTQKWKNLPNVCFLTGSP